MNQKLSFGLFICLSIAIASHASAQEAWCAANSSNCVCSETFQSTSYTRVVDYGNGGSFLGDQVGNKPCHYEGANTSVESVYNSNTFSGSLAISNDASILNLLPHRSPTGVARFLRHAGNSFGTTGQNSTYRMGYDPVPLGTTAKRLALRWYTYYSPDYDTAFFNGCTNGKIARSDAAGGGFPYVTMTWINDSTNAYSFVDSVGWDWPGHSGFDGFSSGHAPRSGSALPFSSLRGKWLRFEIIIRRPRAADSASLGFDWELWITDVTNGTPPHQEMRMSAGCTNCLQGTDTTTFPANAFAYPNADMSGLHTEFYRAADAASGGDGTCGGWQAWLYLAVAKWDTDAGQMIGPAAEVEGGSGNPPDTTSPAKPTGLRVQ